MSAPEPQAPAAGECESCEGTLIWIIDYDRGEHGICQDCDPQGVKLVDRYQRRIGTLEGAVRRLEGELSTEKEATMREARIAREARDALAVSQREAGAWKEAAGMAVAELDYWRQKDQPMPPNRILATLDGMCSVTSALAAADRGEGR